MIIANSEGCTPYEVSRAAVDVVRAEGAYLYDAGGRAHVDLSNAFGSVLLGHNDGAVTSAVLEAVRGGIPAGASLALQHRVAERIAADLGGDRKVAFFKTGTAATRAAATTARLATARRLIVSAGYHGYDPMWEFAPPGRVSAEGVLHVYHLTELLDRALAEYAGEIAAVIISPDYIHVSPEHIGDLFARCRRAGVVTIADEVKQGYRFRPGPSIHGVGATADIYTYAKGIGNGWPIACVAGDTRIMEPLGEFASTLTFETPGFAAAAATLDRLTELDVHARLAADGARFADDAREIVEARDLPIELVGTGAAFQFVCPAELEPVLVAAALDEGLILEPADQQYPSACFRGEVIDDALARFDRACATMAAWCPDIVGRSVTAADRIHAAFHQMDGLPGRPEGWSLQDCVDWATAQL